MPDGALAEALERDFGSIAALAAGVHRHGQGAGRRLGLGAAHLVGARWHGCVQYLGGRPHPQRWPTARRPGARHVRARLSPRFRRQGRRLRRRLHEEHPLGARRRRAIVPGARRSARAAHDRTHEPRELRSSAERGDVLVVDVCLADDRDAACRSACAAPSRDARQASTTWADGLPKDSQVVVYCVYGFQVGGDAAAELRERGIDAARARRRHRRLARRRRCRPNLHSQEGDAS